MAMVDLRSPARRNAGNTRPTTRINPCATGDSAIRRVFAPARLSAFTAHLGYPPLHANAAAALTRTCDPGRALARGPSAPPFCYPISTARFHPLDRPARRD